MDIFLAEIFYGHSTLEECESENNKS